MELIFDLYGRRGSGKSTTLEVLQAVAGNSFGVIKPSTLKPTELFSLIGKKIAYDSDSSGHISDAGKLDKIISNELVLVKQLFFNEWKEDVWKARRIVGQSYKLKGGSHQPHQCSINGME